MENRNRPHVTFLCEQPAWNLSKKVGRTWCTSCQRNIPDLRNASAKEIRELVERDGGESCGIFFPDQFAINPDTKTGPGIYRIMAASLLTVFVAGGKLHAQTQTLPAQTVQTDTSSSSSTAAAEQSVEAQRVADSTLLAQQLSPAEKPLRLRRVNLFRIGAYHYYLSWRFPFLHIRRQFMGRFKY